MFQEHHIRQKAGQPPGQRPPPEILSEIFLLSVVHTLEINNLAIPWRESILLPGQVCRYWRNIAIATPRLWSTLCLDLRLEYTARELDLAKIWLVRSGGAPLTIMLRRHYENQQIHPVIDVVVGHAPRWRILLCQGSLAIIHNLRGAKGNIPLLRHLSILPIFRRDQSMPQSFDTFETAPELRIFYLGGRVSELKPNVPWAQLSELYLPWGQRHTVDDCVQILHDIPKLLAFKVSLSNDEPSLPHSIIHNSNLRDFVMYVYDPAPLFERLTLPALLSLTCKECDTWPGEEFLSFLQRSSCSLQNLILSSDDDIDGIDDHRYGLTECLRHTPHVTELKLLGGVSLVANSVFLREMSYGRSSPPLLPKLRLFEVTRHAGFDYDAFVAMVESRWHIQSVGSTSGERIQSVTAEPVGDLDEWSHDTDYHEKYSMAFEKLLQLQKEGLLVMAPDPHMEPSGSGSSYSLNIDSD